jgi:methylmalonyl-CoA/ethylmalonyl-CoA epimerase
MTPVKINHVAIVVGDMDTALKFWNEALGLPLKHTECSEEEQSKLAFLSVGESAVELIQPTTTDSGVAKYLAKKDAGMHHMCMEVEDIEAAMSQLLDHDIELINESPRLRPDGTRYAFVHPRSTGGVLLELYELVK